MVIGVDINVGIAINAKGGDCWIMLSLMPMVWLIDVIDWCQVIDWLMIDEQCICIDENDRCPSGNQLINMDHWYDA